MQGDVPAVVTGALSVVVVIKAVGLAALASWCCLGRRCLMGFEGLGRRLGVLHRDLTEDTEEGICCSGGVAGPVFELS